MCLYLLVAVANSRCCVALSPAAAAQDSRSACIVHLPLDSIVFCSLIMILAIKRRMGKLVKQCRIFIALWQREWLFIHRELKYP